MATRTQRELILLAALFAAIVVVLAIFIFKGPSVAPEAAYVAPALDARIPPDLIQQPEYRRLELQVDLPVVPGRMGRDNPFEPY